MPTAAASDNRWPDGVAYEIFVRSFADSNGDGIGDLNGVTQSLDYLEDLGVRALWLMPISPSPSYHQYDVTDYRAVHPDYGTLDDLKRLVREAHARRIAVLLDLVINHTASGHPWFQAAAADPASPFRPYYVWATPDEVAVRGAEKATAADSDNRTAWHAVPGGTELFYSYFGRHMPDLNFDHPAVRQEVIDIGRFWLQEADVDGFRLDAAKHIFPDDRAPDNHAWWVEFRTAMQAVKPDVYLVGEVWDEPHVVAPYLQGLPSLFNFNLGYALTRAVQRGRADSLVQRLDRIRDYYATVNPAYVDATFLTNHDQNRIFSALRDDDRKARVAASLLLTLPGAPFLYYGEEIGMRGVKPDPRIREPFLWGGDRAAWETRWTTPVHNTPEVVTPARLQRTDPASLLNHYRALIALRNASPALRHGELAPLDVGSEAVVSFTRTAPEEALWVVHNLAPRPVAFPVPPAAQPFTRLRFATYAAPSVPSDSLRLPPLSTMVLGR